MFFHDDDGRKWLVNMQRGFRKGRFRFAGNAAQEYDHARQRPDGPTLDASKPSDDYGQGLHFTGAMVGLAAHDVAGRRAFADFDYFTLRDDV